jgi:hypothetical protein
MVDSANLETLANAYQRVMKVAPDSIDTKTKRELVIGSLTEASARGVQDEDSLTNSAIAAVTRYQRSTFRAFVRDVLSWLTRGLFNMENAAGYSPTRPEFPPQMVAEKHQPSCFALEEEMGDGWTGGGAMRPAINEARPTL